jgi:hypothetical protein
MSTAVPFPLRLLPARISDFNSHPICPFRSITESHDGWCSGERCAAYRQVDAEHGVCVLIERGTP